MNRILAVKRLFGAFERRDEAVPDINVLYKGEPLARRYAEIVPLVEKPHDFDGPSIVLQTTVFPVVDEVAGIIPPGILEEALIVHANFHPRWFHDIGPQFKLRDHWNDRLIPSFLSLPNTERAKMICRLMDCLEGGGCYAADLLDRIADTCQVPDSVTNLVNCYHVLGGRPGADGFSRTKCLREIIAFAIERGDEPDAEAAKTA